MTIPLEPAARRRLPSPKQLTRLWPRVRPHRKALTLASLALLLSAAIGLGLTFATGWP